jgi:hypothetical protein
MVAQEWASIHKGSNPMEVWQNKIRHLRKFLRGWARNLSGNFRLEKEKLLNIIDVLDRKAEISPLNMEEREREFAQGE